MRNAVIWFAVLMIIYACGGSGGSGSSNAPPANTSTFHLSDDGSYDPGYSISFSLTGASNSGDNFTGSVSISTGAYTTVDDQSVIPIETMVEFENVSTGAKDSSLGTTYVDATTYDPIKMVFPSLNRECTPTSISKEPDLATIGDFGGLTSYTCNDGSSITGSWSLKDAGNGLANLVETAVFFLGDGNVDYIGKTIITIDETGEPLSVSFELWYPSTGIRIALNRDLVDGIFGPLQAFVDFSDVSESAIIIDTVPDPDCNNDGTLDDPEPFINTSANFDIIATGSASSVTLRSYTIQYFPILSADSNGVLRMPPGLTGSLDPGTFNISVPSGSTTAFTTTIMTTDDKAAFETLKAADPALSSLDTARYNIRFTLFVEDEFLREKILILEKTARFGEYNNCSPQD